MGLFDYIYVVIYANCGENGIEKRRTKEKERRGRLTTLCDKCN